jgi:hypothetical protein
MAISTKGRRKLRLDDRLFLWWFSGMNPYEMAWCFFVISQDGKFAVQYAIGPYDRWVIVRGKDFPGVPEAGKTVLRFECPRLEDENGAITPHAVRKFVEWCLSPDKELVQIDGRGNKMKRRV